MKAINILQQTQEPPLEVIRFGSQMSLDKRWALGAVWTQNCAEG